jgi:hypothetical protein
MRDYKAGESQIGMVVLTSPKPDRKPDENFFKNLLPDLLPNQHCQYFFLFPRDEGHLKV